MSDIRVCFDSSPKKSPSLASWPVNWSELFVGRRSEYTMTLNRSQVVAMVCDADVDISELMWDVNIIADDGVSERWEISLSKLVFECWITAMLDIYE